MTNERVHGFANRETYVALCWMTNDEGLLKQIIDDLLADGADFTDAKSVAYYLEGWFYNYLHPWHWKENVGEDMPYDVIVIVGDIGSLWRVNWLELAPAVMSEAKHQLGDEIVTDEEVGLLGLS